MRTTTIFASLLALAFLGLLYLLAEKSNLNDTNIKDIKGLSAHYLQHQGYLWLEEFAKLDRLGWKIGFQISLVFAISAIPLCFIGVVRKRFERSLAVVSIIHSVCVICLFLIHGFTALVLSNMAKWAWQRGVHNSQYLNLQATMIAEAEGVDIQFIKDASVPYTSFDLIANPAPTSSHEREMLLFKTGNLLEESLSISAKRRFVARAPWFADALLDSGGYPEIEARIAKFMKCAEEAAGRSFENPQEFLDWLATKSGDDSWKPVPNYRWEKTW